MKEGAVMELFTAKSSMYDYPKAQRRTADTDMWRSPYIIRYMFVCSRGVCKVRELVCRVRGALQLPRGGGGSSRGIRPDQHAV
jgi:hypothetical protein